MSQGAFLSILGHVVRKKKNKSGVISIQVIDKSSGRYKVIKTMGSSSETRDIERLLLEGKDWIIRRKRLQGIDFTDYRKHTEHILDGIEELSVRGTELLLGKLFDEIGFNAIPDKLFRQLVIARLCYLVSKLKTTDYLLKYQFP